MRRLFFIVAFSLAGFCTTAQAEPPFSFETTPGKLPKDVVPEHYRLHLVPDYTAMRFRGSETVRIAVKTATSKIVLNALNLEIDSARLTGRTIAAQELVPTLDADRQTLSFALAKPLAPGSYELAVDYSGIINPQPQGLYYDKYVTPAGEKLLLGTQMEPTDARRLLPSWDEPAFRASFELSIDLPAAIDAYSNTPIVSSQLLDNGLKRVSFAPTPKMASYLIVLVAGELDRVQAMKDGVEVGVVSTRGKKHSADYALKISQELLGYYNDYFGQRYPLPKLDQIATPGGFQGAMENWGGILYNEAVLLYDPDKSTEETRQRVYTVVAHEMAHQWFGDLVTMSWWDNLWLNEGFASWMGTKATDHFNPDWDHWLAANAERERVMALDARKTTHPIQQPVRNESEANDAFDDITYLKGQAFLRMLETWLGEVDFRSGIRAYMAKHQYSSTTTADLWVALEAASKKPVARIAADWTIQPGFPVVKVDATCINGQRHISLTQEQFKLDDTHPGARRWRIPVAIATVGDAGATAAQFTLLSARTTRVIRPGCDGALVLDPDAVGYYRVQYAPMLRDALGRQLATLPVSVRLKLISDTWALVEADRLPAHAYFALLSKLGAEPKTAVWTAVLGHLERLDGLARGEAVRMPLRAYARSLLAPKFAALGWDAKPGETFENADLRNKLLTALGNYEDQAVIAEAQRRFQRFLIEPASLPTSIIDPVVDLAGRHADQATWDALIRLAIAAPTSEEKLRYFHAAGGALDPALAKQTLPLAMSERLPQLLNTQTVAVVANAGEHVDDAWAYAQKNGEQLIGQVAEYSRNDYFPTILGASNEPRLADELEAYVKAHLPSEAATEAHRSADAIRLRAKLKARVLPELAMALKAAGDGPTGQGSVSGTGVENKGVLVH